MNCEEISGVLDAYLDGELDLSGCLKVEQHLEACESCRKALEEREALVTAVREKAPRFEASPYLRTRILASLGEAPAKSSFWSSLKNIWNPALALPALALVVVVGMLVLPGSFSSSSLMDEAMANHVRSLQANHLTDVVSSDQHTVKPWFTGKLDYSPQVVDLGPSGYALIGGRLDFLDHRDVAALVYHRRKHDINLFVWPGTGKGLPSGLNTRNGYHFLGWTKSGMNYLAVSELAENELREFTKLIQEQTN